MKDKKILFVNQETAPFNEENPMSVLGRDLPSFIQGQGNEIRTFMPKWGTINERRGQLHEVKRLSGMNLIIDDTDHPLIIKVASVPVSRLQVYFIDNDDFFKKRQLEKDELGNLYPDNGQRAIFFARGVMETVKKLRWAPDIIYCQGWMSAVISVYAKVAYHDEPSFANTKIITSIFTESITSDLGQNFKKSLIFKDVDENLVNKYGDSISFLELGKMAIDYSDGVVEASNEINKELLKYVKDKKIPFMPYPGEDGLDAYSEFFDKIIGNE